MEALLALTVRSGRILRISLPAGEVQTLTDQAGPTPDGIVVEAGTVYWTTMGVPEVHGPTEADRDYSRRDGGVHAIGLDGCGRRDVVPAGVLTTGKQLASDGAGTLYWGDREGCRISRVGTDGTGLADLVVRQRDDSWTQECVGVAIDPRNQWVYWTQKGPVKGGQGRIFRAGLDVPAGQSPCDRDDIELLWDRLPEPIDLHLDGDWLYWTDRGAAPNGNTLNRSRVPAPGDRGDVPEILAGGFAEAIGLAVDSAAMVAYVSDLGGHIRQVPIGDRAAAHGQARIVVAVPEPVTGVVAI